MKKCLLIFIMILIILLTNMMIFAQENENEETIYENEVEEENIGLDVDNGISNNEIESRIIIRPGAEEQVDTLFVDKFATYYFYNLTDNFGYNYIGSCSYTAAAMLLSYYDTFWNDAVISDDLNYEQDRQWISSNYSIDNITNSPGIIAEPHSIINQKKNEKGIPTTEELPKKYYKELVSEYKSQYFHLKLISIGLDTGIDLLDDYVLFPASVKDLLEYYLYNVAGFSESEVTVDHITGFEKVREYAINKIKQGIPVFVSATSLLDGAHSYIIYDYDETNDELYCHLGWYKNQETQQEYTHVAFSSIPYQGFEGAVSISFNSEHSCSNNYVDVYGNSYCSCYFSCHPEHEHTYSPTADGSYHTYSCSCRLKETPNFEHSLYISEINEDGHRYKCSTCNYESELIEHDMRIYLHATPTQHGYKCRDCGHIDESTVETHSYDYWGYLNSTTHVSECGCGARGTTTASHVYTFPDSDGWMTCIGCGYTKIFGSDSGLIIMSTTKVSSNGSRIISDGTIMLVDEDIEAYLDGTLVFYDKDNLPQTQ